MNIRYACACAAALIATALSAPGWSHDGHTHGHAQSQQGAAQPVRLADTVLVDQNGRSLRLANAVGDRIAVVTFVYTSCADTCPMVSQTFSQVQERLGALMDSRVRLISLTIDPARDTPSQLKAYSANFGAGPGWLWLTGKASSITEALHGFGIHVKNIENHPSVVLVGDVRSGSWTRLYDIDSADKVLAEVTRRMAAKTADHGLADGTLQSALCMHAARASVLGPYKPACVARPAG